MRLSANGRELLPTPQKVIPTQGIRALAQQHRRACLLQLAAVLAAPVAPVLAFGPTKPLWERLDEKELPKPLFNFPPGEQVYPEWLEGLWDVTSTFSGYSFPLSVDKARLVSDPTVPGFTKLSILYVPDVGSGGRHQLRFVRRAGDGVVTEDRAFNVTSIVNGYLGKPAVQSVDYSGQDPNRCTVRLVPGASPNAERIELFVNARESATRPSDGAFFCLESLRQESLGYGRQFGSAPRALLCDYTEVWSYIQVAPGRVAASLSTAAYLQPGEALKYTAAYGPGRPPQLGGLVGVVEQPVALYSHMLDMRRAHEAA